MRTLVIDTSTERGIIAFLKGQDLLYHCDLPFGFQNSQHLLPSLQNGIDMIGKEWHHLDFITVGVGPGSYTGIRVGVITAKTLSFARSIPLVGVCSLDGFLPCQDGPFASIIDAKIGGIYVQRGMHKNGTIYRTHEPQVFPLTHLASLMNENCLLVTPNASQLKTKAEIQTLPNVRWHECYPSPQHLAAIASQKFARGEVSLDGRLELLYMRKTQAEIDRSH